ncbi:TREX2.2 family protein [Megaselia abdita]
MSKSPERSEEKRCFESFAVFDLETNTLPGCGRRVNITELTIYAVSKKDFIESEEKTIPRIVNKLNLVVRPLGAIDPKAEEITGLSNYALEKESTFTGKTCDMINLFLDHLQKPVCLVAHNGDYFDFKILKDHFRKQEKQILDGLMTVDSIKAFKFIDAKKEEEAEKASKEDILEPLPELTEELLEKDKKEDLLNEDLDLFEQLLQSDNMNFQKINETTPKSSKIKMSQKKVPKSKRSLFETTPSTKKPRTSYKLVDVFQRMTGEEPINAHQSAGDVEMLLKSMLHYGKPFLDYCEKNAVDF